MQTKKCSKCNRRAFNLFTLFHLSTQSLLWCHSKCFHWHIRNNSQITFVRIQNGASGVSWGKWITFHNSCAEPFVFPGWKNVSHQTCWKMNEWNVKIQALYYLRSCMNLYGTFMYENSERSFLQKTTFVNSDTCGLVHKRLWVLLLA
jgi:hypothetical protein